MPAGISIDARGTPHIAQRLADKRHGRKRAKSTIRLLYVVGYLLVAGLLCWLIRQAYLASL